MEMIAVLPKQHTMHPPPAPIILPCDKFVIFKHKLRCRCYFVRRGSAFGIIVIKEASAVVYLFAGLLTSFVLYKIGKWK